MCFGLTNAPATFCGLEDKIFGDIKQNFCLLYIDDFSVYSQTFDEHLIHLEEVLQMLRSAVLKVKPAKCAFGESSITFLGHKLPTDGLSPDPEKVKSIHLFYRPSNRRTLRGWLGITNYVRRFIPDYAELAEPVTKLLLKNQFFDWGQARDGCLKEQKRRLMTAPVLAHFDPLKPVEILTDAYAVGVGAVLIQQHEDGEHPVAYTSKAFNRAQKTYGATELELFAVKIAVEKFHYYIGNLPSKVGTDHSAIGALLKTKNPANRLADGSCV